MAGEPSRGRLKKPQSGRHLIFEADLPGIGQPDLDISMAGNRLTITGKREGSSRGQGENVYTAERSFGCFCRAFSLPDGVDPNGITADLKEGVLTLTLPKSAAVQSKKINIAMNAPGESMPASPAEPEIMCCS
jgi:HSP20 family protein